MNLIRLTKDPVISILVFTGLLSGYAYSQYLAAGSAAAEVTETTPAPIAPPTAMAASAQTTSAKSSASADVIGKSGAVIGTATITSSTQGMWLRVSLPMASLSPGWHGLHLHENADCSDVGVFKTSGNVIGGKASGSGRKASGEQRPGDLPNIHAGNDGSAYLETFSTLVSLDALQADGGFALIVHEGEDDHAKPAIGGAGARVACAAFTF